MAIITAAGLTDLYNQRTFNKNGSTVTLKKISETDWILFGDLAEGDSEGFGVTEPVLEGFVIKTTDGVVAEIEGPGEVQGTGILVVASGMIYGPTQLEEVVSWPEEKPDWLEGNGISLYQAERLTKVPDTLPTWITDASSMFGYCSIFSQDLSGWDTSNVTNMTSMFHGCSSFNGDLSGWDTSKVTNMAYMFRECSNFNQDISGWDVSNVTDMGHMFNGCSSFNQDLSGWDTSNVTNMWYMFNGCSSFNQDLSGWCVTNITRKPSYFDANTPAWVKTKRQPIWGTCPQG